MPWKETRGMDERIGFISEWLKGECTMVELCRAFAISRKTGYKWVDRYREYGPQGLLDRSRAPKTRPNAVPGETIQVLVQVRKAHPTWGPRKVLGWLRRTRPQLGLPAASTVGELFDRYGLIQKRRRRRKVPPYAKSLGQTTAPNEVWAADHKGDFKLGNGQRCYPLTISDEFSRFVLRCQAGPSVRRSRAQPVFASAFRQFGLPDAIRTDNGPPFATKAPHGLSRLSIWWLKLGIRHERIQPGRPDQNGRHERMHRTLKQETLRPPEFSMRSQQRRFDDFCGEFNYDRPHEALDDATPGSIYERSGRDLPAELPSFVYPASFTLRTVHESGRVRWLERSLLHIGAALAGETIGFERVEPKLWFVFLGSLQLGVVDRGRLDLGLIPIG